MRTLTTLLLAVLAIGTISASTADASCSRRGGYSYHKRYHSYPRKVVVREPIVEKVIVEKPVFVEKKVYIPTPVPTPVAAQYFRPQKPICVVQPGDTWYKIAHRLYGTPAVWPYLARYNGVAPTTQLNVGQQLQMPVINQNGTFGQSSGPGANNGFSGPTGQPNGLPQQFGQPNAAFNQFNQPMGGNLGQMNQPVQLPPGNVGQLNQLNQLPAGQPNQQIQQPAAQGNQQIQTPAQPPAAAPNQAQAGNAVSGNLGQLSGFNLTSLGQLQNLLPVANGSASGQ